MSNYQGSAPDTEPAREWLAQALCAMPHMAKYRDLFFPTSGEKNKTAAAKQICAACPVRASCLADALAEEGGRAHDNRHGIRGGLSPRGRRNRHDRARKARQQEAEPAEPKALTS